jgi:hypothetical protein
MEYRSVLTNANKLKKKSLYKITLADSTKDILYQINTSIMNAQDAGLSVVQYKLPLNFPIINNVSNTEVQTAIYYNIVSELERMEYNVRLAKKGENHILIINWIVKAGISELEKMQKKLASLYS